MSSIQKLEQVINKHKIISFDIFDTLIFRCVSKPTDIFSIVEYYYNASNTHSQIHDFKKKRMEAELKAREQKQCEITLDEIYEQIDISESIKNEVKRIEIEIEIAFSMSNEEMKAIYNYARQKGKRIFITSDMYLPEETIQKILAKCGYEGYEELLLSNSLMKRKKDGSLFDYLIDITNSSTSDIVHIGDNKKSDYYIAKRKKIDAFHYRYSLQKNDHFNVKSFDRNKIQNDVFLSLCEKSTKYMTDSEAFGFNVLGLPLLGFCQWLFDYTKGKDKFFLARDGSLIKRAYLELFPEEERFCHYLYISRRALRRPSMFLKLPFEEFVEQLPSLKEYTADSFMKLCMVSNQYMEKWFVQFQNVGAVNGRRSLSQNVEYKNMYYSIINNDFDNLCEQYSFLRRYLQQENMNGEAFIVDVGWRGSAQKNIQAVIGADAHLSGYYFGVEKTNSYQSGKPLNMKGYFWGIDEDNSMKSALLNGRKALFEILFLSEEGSAIGYKEKDEIVFPELDKENHYESESIVNMIQNGAIRLIHQQKNLLQYIPPYEAKDTYVGFLGFVMHPRKRDLFIGDVICENQRVAYIAKPKSLKEYIINPHSFKEDFLNAEWKVGFVNRLIPMNKTGQYILNGFYEKLRNK